MRVLKEKGNVYDISREWIRPYLTKVNYRVLDISRKYNPDIVGDIHNLPLSNNSEDAVICIAVLEHVANPHKAMQEIYRVLKPGGYCFIYVPFLYLYHPHQGYYQDYWRFTEDAIRLLSKTFSSIELQKVRKALETWIYLSPLGKFKTATKLARLLDQLFIKNKYQGTSGFMYF